MPEQNPFRNLERFEAGTDRLEAANAAGGGNVFKQKIEHLLAQNAAKAKLAQILQQGEQARGLEGLKQGIFDIKSPEAGAQVETGRVTDLAKTRGQTAESLAGAGLGFGAKQGQPVDLATALQKPVFRQAFKGEAQEAAKGKEERETKRVKKVKRVTQDGRPVSKFAQEEVTQEEGRKGEVKGPPEAAQRFIDQGRDQPPHLAKLTAIAQTDAPGSVATSDVQQDEKGTYFLIRLKDGRTAIFRPKS